MKIAIPSKGKLPDSEMDERFGRAEYFMIITLNKDSYSTIEGIENISKDDSSGVGTKAVKNLADIGVDTIIVKGEIGPKAWAVIKEFEIQVYDGKEFETSSEAFNNFDKGLLPKVEEPKSGLRRA